MASPALIALILVFVCLVILVFFFSSAIRIVPENKRLMVYRLGRYIGERGPGIVVLLPTIDRAIVRDLGALNPAGAGLDRLYVQRMTSWSAKTTTSVFRDGGKVVLDNGENVDAISEMPLEADKSVRVKRVIVEVESID